MDKKKLPRIIWTIVLILLGLANIFPFIFMLSSSFKPLNQIFTYPIKLIPETFIWSNYTELFSEQYSFIRWYINTGVMVVTNIALKLFIVTITAYAFAKMRFKGRDTLFLVLLSSMMIPPDAVIIPKYVIFKSLHLTDTMWSLILPAIFDVFFVFMLRQAFISIPNELSEAAIIDGCGHFRIYSRIVLPMAGPSIATVIVFTFIWAWNDYMSPYIFISDPQKQMLSVGMKMFQVSNAVDYGLLMAGATLVLIPVLLVFVFAQRFFVQGIATSGMKN
ncbi:sugar ABC transporter permease [Gemmiger sp. An120]|uniref:carbohydrate ABC transporter permease n=1 Tax=Gemmiger sp. An120 TaxID=1965549 RepID=UPI000B3959AC|nr:carbohydrate ABC transporter permease [Gemmiger sp. An120]OUQ43234.1 sugar ABC transporter permease [Gemmiger sp. An120]